jgi:hypothetical protein
MGYSADIIEFIATEHTPKNLMIRALQSSSPGNSKFIQEYNQLKAFWGVTPYLETVLGSELTSMTGVVAPT